MNNKVEKFEDLFFQVIKIDKDIFIGKLDIKKRSSIYFITSEGFSAY